ncbi:MAG TPA: hypothetical protein DCY79_22450 [Planctomycetaceae bacterium]|nr:hypothetical protein [Planctomycetaceae bacterium]
MNLSTSQPPPLNSSTESESAAQLSPMLVLEAARRWWAIATPVGLLAGLIVAAILYLQFEPLYEAKALLRITTPISFDGSKNKADRSFLANQFAVLYSVVTLEPLLADKEIATIPDLVEADDPIAELKRNLSIKSAYRDSNQWYLTYRSTDPQVAAMLANRIYESFIRTKGDFDVSLRSALLSRLEELRKDKEDDVDRLRQDFRNEAIRNLNWDPYAVAQTESDPGASALSYEKQLAKLAIDQAIVQYQIERAQGIHQKVEENLNAQSESIEISDTDLATMVDQSADMLQHNEDLARAQAAIKLLRKELAEIEQIAAGDPANLPRYQSAQRQIALQQEQIEKLDAARQPLRESLMEVARKDRQGAWKTYQQEVISRQKEEVARLQEQTEQMAIEERVVTEKYQAEIEEIQNAKGRTFDMVQLQTSLERAEEQALAFQDREDRLRLESKNLDSITLLKSASPPVKPAVIAPWKNMLMGGGIALLIPFGLAVLWELRVGRITDSKQIEKQSQLPVLAEIARFPSHADGQRHSRRVTRQLRLFEESVHHLRTSLVLSRPLEDIQVLAVTSSVSGEGKTTLAAQLAMSIARASGQPTLLIDGDMRAPDLYDVFEIPNQPGFADLLEDHNSLGGYVTKWDEHCHVLPAGQLTSSPHRLLANGAFSGMLKEARATYKHIVIDTPPILAAGESMVMAKAADATILCAKRDVTRMEQLKKSRERLKGAGAEIVGCVFNDVPPNRYSYRYGYYGYEDHGGV